MCYVQQLVGKLTGVLLRYSAEAVQIGHVCSAAGVAGIWTGAHHDRGKLTLTI